MLFVLYTSLILPLKEIELQFALLCKNLENRNRKKIQIDRGIITATFRGAVQVSGAKFP